MKGKGGSRDGNEIEMTKERAERGNRGEMEGNSIERR
jgi:hypothetical protein